MLLSKSMAWSVLWSPEKKNKKSVVESFGVARVVISRLQNRFEARNVRCRSEQGRPRATTGTDDIYLMLTIRQTRLQNATRF